MASLKLVVDNTQPIASKRRRAIDLASEIADAPGGVRMLRGIMPLLAPIDAEQTAILTQCLIQSMDTGQLETVLKVLESYRNLATARP